MIRPSARKEIPVRNSYTSIFSLEELKNALPRVSFFDCHAKVGRLSEDMLDPAKQHDFVSSKRNNREKISFNNLAESHEEGSPSQNTVESEEKTMMQPKNKTRLNLRSCKIANEKIISKKSKLSTCEGRQDLIFDSQTNSINSNKGNNSKELVINETSSKMPGLKYVSERAKHENPSSESKLEKEEPLQVLDRNSQGESEGFQYLMDYLLCLMNNSAQDNNNNIDSLSSQMKSNNPKYFLDSLKRSASIFAPQHRVYGQKENDLLTVTQELDPRLIALNRPPTNLETSDGRYGSDLAFLRYRLERWIESVSTNQFIENRDKVLSVLGNGNDYQTWHGIQHCRYLRLTTAQQKKYLSHSE